MTTTRNIKRYALGMLVGMAALSFTITSTTNLAGSPWDHTAPNSRVHVADGSTGDCGSPWDHCNTNQN
jgi:hypothetical protein